MQWILTLSWEVIQPFEVCIRKRRLRAHLTATKLKSKILMIATSIELTMKRKKIISNLKRIYHNFLLIGVLERLASWNRSIFTRNYRSTSTQPGMLQWVPIDQADKERVGAQKYLYIETLPLTFKILTEHVTLQCHLLIYLVELFQQCHLHYAPWLACPLSKEKHHGREP